MSSCWAWSDDSLHPGSRRLRPRRPHPLHAAHTHPRRAGWSRSPGLPRIAKGGRYLGRPGLATSSGLQRGRASCARWGWGAQQAQAWAQPEAELQGPGRREGRRGGLLGRAGITSRFRHRLNQRGRGRGARNALPGRVWRGKFSHAACGGPPSRVLAGSQTLTVPGAVTCWAGGLAGSFLRPIR